MYIHCIGLHLARGMMRMRIPSSVYIVHPSSMYILFPNSGHHVCLLKSAFQSEYEFTALSGFEISLMSSYVISPS